MRRNTSVVVSGPILAVLLILLSCGRTPDDQWLVHEIGGFASPAEMSLQSNSRKIRKICRRIVARPALLADLSVSYRNSEDDGLRERIIYVAWELSFYCENRPALGSHLRPLLLSALEDRNVQVRRLAAASLARCPDESLVSVFVAMFGQPDSALWVHATRGLWRIGAPTAMTNLLQAIVEKRQDNDYVRRIMPDFAAEDDTGTRKREDIRRRIRGLLAGSETNAPR